MSEADPIVIRPANDADRDFVAGLVSSLLEFGSPMWRDAEALAPGFREALIRALANRDARSPLLIAQDEDGTPLGFISLKVSKDMADVERGHVADLAVKANARRTGVGSALMGAAEAWAREQRLPALSLDVWSTNERALTFYGHLGYRPESLCLVKPLNEPAGSTSAAGELAVRPLRTDERAWLDQQLIRLWGSTRIVSRGRLHEASKLPALVCQAGEERVGLVTFDIRDRQCELVTLDAFAQKRGIGSALLAAVVAEATRRGCHRLWLITSNDNLQALRFYQRHGMRLAALYRGAIDEARRIQPEIPPSGKHDIPIHDELEVELPLD
jgi:ribosomal protein S18 acetylase RimI-like enzyme